MDATIATFLAAIIAVLAYLYKYLKESYKFWEEKGVPYIEPNLIFGNMMESVFLRVPQALFHRELYRKLAPHKFGGIYQLQKPILLIRDPELLKHVLVKDFYHFQNRGFKFYKDVEPLAQHLFSLNGQDWKNLRIKLTTTFTTGKMKLMFPLMDECASRLENVLDQVADGLTDIDMKDITARYTTDVIGNCAFGIEISSLENPDTEFRKIAKDIFKFRYRVILRFLFPNTPPGLVKLFDLSFTEKKISDFFLKIVKDMVEYREKNKVIRNDFLGLLIQLKNESNSGEICQDEEEVKVLKQLMPDEKDKSKVTVDMTPDLMAAQCFLFFGAGFETSSNALTFMLFELAQNKHIQTKLHDEITRVLEQNNEKLTYDILKEMKYLDMVICETLRKYPPATALMRTCTIEYTIPDTKVVIPEGTPVIVPVMGIHQDEQYYKNPDEFNPENFTEEAKSTRPAFAYLPFGEGPRVCIAERFAKMEVQTAIIHMVKNYEFSLSPKMKLPIEFEKNFGLLAIKGGTWLRCTKRV